MLREGLRAILDRESEVEVVGESADGLAAIEAAIALRPDVVIMDIGMRRMNGIEATREIRARLPGCRVIALSVHSDRRYLDRMFEAGAQGYVLKEAASHELIEAIRTVASGHTYVSPSLSRETLPQLSPSARDAYQRLAPREREVLKLLAEGDTSRGIAVLLSISPRTVETHRRNIMRKLGLHSVAELTKYAIREGLTSVEP
jgi:two-component system NarL family response regulator